MTTRKQLTLEIVGLIAAAAVICLWALTAVAQEVAPVLAPTAPTGDPWWAEPLVYVFVGFGGVLIAGLRKILAPVFEWLASKTHLAFVARIDDAALDIVTDIYNNEVEAVKASAPGNRLSKEQREKYNKIARDTLKGYIGSKGGKKLLEVAGGQENVEAFLRAKIEKAVTVAQNAGKAARSVNPTRPT
jgi:hypothetical protein